MTPVLGKALWAKFHCSFALLLLPSTFAQLNNENEGLLRDKAMEEYEVIELSLPIDIVNQQRALKKEKTRGRGKQQQQQQQYSQDEYAKLIAQYQEKYGTAAFTSNSPAASQPATQTKETVGIIQSTPERVYIKGGTIDLRGVSGNPSTVQRTCVERKPLLGCDRGGADNQIMTFLGKNFGSCKTCDRGLFRAMPIKMAYYCPTYGRPACGGSCQADAAADGFVRDKEGGIYIFCKRSEIPSGRERMGWSVAWKLWAVRLVHDVQCK